MSTSLVPPGQPGCLCTRSPGTLHALAAADNTTKLLGSKTSANCTPTCTSEVLALSTKPQLAEHACLVRKRAQRQSAHQQRPPHSFLSSLAAFFRSRECPPSVRLVRCPRALLLPMRCVCWAQGARPCAARAKSATSDPSVALACHFFCCSQAALVCPRPQRPRAVNHPVASNFSSLRCARRFTGVSTFFQPPETFAASETPCACSVVVCRGEHGYGSSNELELLEIMLVSGAELRGSGEEAREGLPSRPLKMGPFVGVSVWPAFLPALQQLTSAGCG